MNELETMARAKMYIEKLANGINPLTNTELPADDIVNNVRISRCFFYIADVLGQVLDNGGIQKKASTRKEPFFLTPEQISAFEISRTPVSVSDFVEKINNVIDINSMKKLKTTSITNWLVDIEMLEVIELPTGKTRKSPTIKGNSIGIITETRFGHYGEYTIVLYNDNAQQFIMDNIDAVIAINNQKKSKRENALESTEWNSVHDEVLKDLSAKNFTAAQIAEILKRSAEDVNSRQQLLGYNIT